MTGLASLDVPAAEDVVGTRQIAERLGVETSTVHQWRQRDLKIPMPPPRGDVSGVPWWSWKDIERWARKTGRLPKGEG